MSKSTITSIEDLSKYSINLLWINKDKHSSQTYIHPSENCEKLLLPAMKWGIANPEGIVNIWYDSALYNNEIIERTKTALANSSELTNIKLKDIRSIDFVNNNSDIFAKTMPLYFRVDFLKIIICLHELETKSMDGTIFSDLEVGDLRPDGGRMNKAELFDAITMSKLQQLGMVKNGAENQFIQMIHDDDAITALRYSVNLCLMRAVTIVNENVEIQKYIMPTMYSSPFFCVTENGISTIYHAIKTNTLEAKADFLGIKGSHEWIKYNPDEHGYKAFGNGLNTHQLNTTWTTSYTDLLAKTIISPANMIRFDSTLPMIDNSRRDTDTRGGDSHIDKIHPHQRDVTLEANFWPQSEHHNLHTDVIEIHIEEEKADYIACHDVEILSTKTDVEVIGDDLKTSYDDVHCNII